MTKKILMIAPVLTQSGYGAHSRQVVQYLFNLIDQGVDIELDINPIGCGQTQFLINKSDPFVARIYKNCVRRNMSYDVTIQIQMPSPKEWNPNIAPVNIGITAGIETDICSQPWLHTINRMTHVIVPSNYTSNAFQKASITFNIPLTTPVSVVKEYISDEFYKEAGGEDPLADIKTKFNLLVFGQLTGLDRDTDRKNLFAAVQTFYAAFHNRTDCGIIVKTNCGRETELDKKVVSLVLSQIKEAVCDMTNGQGKQPEIYCLHGFMNEEELRKIYQSPKVNALFSCTRGEAVGLPLVEATAAGLPVIVTDKGGHTEYLSPNKWIGLPSKLVDVPQKKHDEEIFIAGSKWFEVEPQETIQALQKFEKNQSKPREWAKSERQVIKNKLSKEAIFAEYDKVLKPYLV